LCLRSALVTNNLYFKPSTITAFSVKSALINNHSFHIFNLNFFLDFIFYSFFFDPSRANTESNLSHPTLFSSQIFNYGLDPMPTAPRVLFLFIFLKPPVANFRGCAFLSRHSMRLWPHLPFQNWRISAEGVFLRSKTRHPTANSYIEAARQSAYLSYSQITITYPGLHLLFTHDTAHVRSKNHESICMSRPSLIKYCAVSIVIILGFMLHHSAFPNLKILSFFLFYFYLSTSLIFRFDLIAKRVCRYFIASTFCV
jgi:hypothetical protein